MSSARSPREMETDGTEKEGQRELAHGSPDGGEVASLSQVAGMW